MSLAIETDRPPPRIDADGVVRIGGTRVTLDTIVAAFQEGATAEEIAQQRPSLDLADVHATIGSHVVLRVNGKARFDIYP